MNTDTLLRGACGFAALHLAWTARFAFEHLHASTGWRWIVLTNLLTVSGCCLWAAAGRPFSERVRALPTVMPAVAVSGLVILAQAVIVLTGA